MKTKFLLGGYKYVIALIFLISLLNFSCKKTNSNDTGNTTPPKGPIDERIARHWKESYGSTIEIGPVGGTPIPSHEYVDFILKSDGTYTRDYYNQNSFGCLIVILGSTTGYWHVGPEDGGTLYLDELTVHVKATDNCNTSLNSDKDIAPRRIKFIYSQGIDSYGKPTLVLQTTSGPEEFYQD